MEWVEIAGNSLAEVTKTALSQLGVGESDAEIVIVSEPKTGMFGRTKGEARIRARVRPQAPRAKRGRSGGGNGGGRDRDRGGRNRSDRPKQAGKGNGEGREAKPKVKPEAKQSKPRDEKMKREPREEAVSEEISIERQSEAGKLFLEGLLEAYGLEGVVAIRNIDDDTVELTVSGENLGLLVGPRGSTLTALQEITRTAIQNQLPGNRQGRLLVDVAQYRQRRAEALGRFATQIAEEVIAEGEERALEPMAAPDRKVVHDTVNAMDGVETRSEGEDMHRHIVIVPVS